MLSLSLQSSALGWSFFLITAIPPGLAGPNPERETSISSGYSLAKAKVNGNVLSLSSAQDPIRAI